MMEIFMIVLEHIKPYWRKDNAIYWILIGIWVACDTWTSIYVWYTGMPNLSKFNIGIVVNGIGVVCAVYAVYSMYKNGKE